MPKPTIVTLLSAAVTISLYVAFLLSLGTPCAKVLEPLSNLSLALTLGLLTFMIIRKRAD